MVVLYFTFRGSSSHRQRLVWQQGKQRGIALEHVLLPCRHLLADRGDRGYFNLVSTHFPVFPLVWERAQGFNVFDPKGNKWIDFTSAIFIANIGHSNPLL